MICKDRLSEYAEWRASWLFHDRGPYHRETSLLSCKVNQWTGFYTTGTWLTVILKGFIKYPFFLFSFKRFHRQAFIIYENGENL